MSKPHNSALDDMAAAYLNADVEATRQQIASITKEILKLEANRRALEYKVNRLSPDSNPSPASAVPKAPLRSNGEATTVVDTTSASAGFRENIRNLLRGTPKGMKPIDVTKKLVANGLNYNGKTDLNVRVANDLNKMFRSGSIKRRAGHYYIALEPTNADLLA